MKFESSSPFIVAEIVTIPLPDDESPEDWGDHLLFWCRENEIRCKWIDRGTPDSVTFGFESMEDAVLFRLRAP